MSTKGGLLLPTLAFAGTATACAVLTYNLGSQYYAEKYMNRYRERLSQEKDDAENENNDQAAMVGNVSTKTNEAVEEKEEEEEENKLDQLSRQSCMLMVMLLQDGFMLLALLGVGLMVLVVLVALALVIANDGVHSPIQLQMFAPLMYVSMGMILVGMINSMLRGSRKPKPHVMISRPETRKNINTKTTTVILGDEEETEPKVTKRKSKCPFGFG